MLVPYQRQDFIWRPSKPSKASLGLCSRCTRDRPAKYQLETTSGSHWAYCELHAQLYRLRAQESDLRAALANPELERFFREVSA